MAKKSGRKSQRRAPKGNNACCPVIHLKCTGGGWTQGPDGVRKKIDKKCSVRVGSGKTSSSMTASKAGAAVGRAVRAQKRRRCMPVVKGGAAVPKLPKIVKLAMYR